MKGAPIKLSYVDPRLPKSNRPMLFLAVTALLATFASALNLGGNIRLYTNFDTAYPLSDSQWEFVAGGVNALTIGTGLIEGSTQDPVILRTDIPYCSSQDFVLQMNARIQYSAVLAEGSTVGSLLGWTEDPFYGCAWTGAMNEQGWRFQFLITSTKVYALYARYEDFAGLKTAEALPPRRFAYIIPIQTITATDINDYSVNMKAGEYDVSWRINNVEKLIIRNVGQTISKKFLVWSDESTFVYQPVAFPDALYMEIGVGSMGNIGPIGLPNTVCQRAVWDMCTQNLFNAPRCFCRYGSQQVDGWNVDSTAQVSNVFIARLTDVQHCLDGGVDNPDSTADRWWTRN